MYYYDSSLAMHSCVTCTVTDGSNILYIQTPVVTDAMQINVVVGSLQQKRVQVYTDEMEVHVNSALNACNTAPITTVGNALANPASDTSSILIPILGNGAIQVAPNLPPGSYFITFSFDNLSALDETLAFDFGSATKMTISTSMLNTRIGPFAVVDSTTVLRLNVDSDAIPVILTSILFTPAIDTSRKAVVRALTENPTGSKLLRVDGGHIPPDAQVACVQNMRHGAVYVAGEFQTSLVSNIARLELTLPMASLAGFGLDRRVTVMSAFADLLVIGGDFTARVAIDGIAGRYAAASHVALFDTKAEKWIDIGGLDSPPSQISIDRIHHTARFSGQFTKTFDLPLDAVASGPGAEREALGVAVWSFAENRWIETIENVQGSIISSLYVEVGAGADKLVLIINAGADAAAAAAVKINSPAGFANLNTSGFQKLFDSEKHNLGISNVTSVAWNPVDELLFVAFKYAEQDKVADQEERYGVGNYASSTQKWTLLPAVFKSPVLDLAYLSDQGLLLICGNFQSLSSTAGGPGRSAKGMAVWSHWAQKWGEMPVELSNTHLNLTDSLQENLHEPVGVESIRRISPNRVLVHGRFNFSNPPSNENKQLKTTQCTDLCYFDTVTGTWDSGPQVASGRIDAVAVYKVICALYRQRYISQACLRECWIMKCITWRESEMMGSPLSLLVKLPNQLPKSLLILTGNSTDLCRIICLICTIRHMAP